METTQHHPDRMSAIKSANSQVTDALDARKFCVISVYIDSQNRLVYGDTSFQFPLGDFDEVLRMIRKSFDRQRGVDAPPPLPVADHVASFDHSIGNDTLGDDDDFPCQPC